MSDDDDLDFTSTNQSSKNLASLFHGGDPAATVVASTAAYVPPKQPKKDSPPKIMIATAVQAFSLGADQKWTPRGKMGVALLSTDNTLFQLILYLTKTQHITSARIMTTTILTSQPNNYLSFQDDSAQNWSIMFDNKQALVDFILQFLLAKAYLFAFKFDHIIQDIREGEGSALVDQDSAEITVNMQKLLENGTISPADNGETKPVKFKIGKQQNGKAFDDSLRGMKKNGQRVAMIGNVFYNIEVTRIKREKDARANSVTTPAEEPQLPPQQLPPPTVERKRTITEDNENSSEKNKMLQRINRMGGVSMLPNQNQNQTSAFAAPMPPNLTSFSDDDSINNEFIQNVVVPPRSITTPVPPVQFVQPAYHPHHHPQAQHLLQQSNMYTPQQPLHDYNNRPASSMGVMPGMGGYQQLSMWPPSQYPQTSPNMPPTDMFYQQQQQQQPFQNDFRQLLNRLTEKVDVLNEKFDTKNSTSYPNMETSIVLGNIQRIVKENDTMKKDLFDRSAKVEELNLKISELLDRNQKLIEQSHQTFEQRNVVVNNVSEQTAQKILDLEKQKVELTNNLSISTSKIADLQLQINQYTQDINENQSRLSTLLHKCEQYKDDLQKSENQRSEMQMKFDTFEEQLKNDKSTKKQLQTNLNALEEELAELKITCANLEKASNERKLKYENERKRWQDDVDEQKTTYESELDELRAKLRKQRTNDSLTSNQEISRIEQDLEREWQEKLDRQQTQNERLLALKGKEFEQLKQLFNENENRLTQANEELNESKQQIEAYEERFEKLQERLVLMKEKIIEMNDEQPQLINEQVKRAINIIFQRLKTRIRPTKQYSGEEFLSRSLEIIKKATLKVISNDDNDNDNEPSSDDIESDVENDQVQTTDDIEKNDQPSNGNSVDQVTLNEEISSVKINENENIQSIESDTTSGNSQKNGWDTVDDFQQEEKPQSEETLEQSQMVLVSEDTTSSVNDTETTSPLDSTIENNEATSPLKTVEQEHDSDGSADTVEQNDKESPPEIEIPEEKPSSDSEDDDDALFQSARPSVQDIPALATNTQTTAAPRYKFNENIPLMTNPDDSDDEMFK
ncbi:unnamed protein product [Adineta steineri]|uniref:FK506-binding protein 15-like domain-containing protein n=1 Tax=Adineta steineri TaxID=433720 RepID=A0A818QTQ9_9BILA|nr:unnamed protein product [Adineta steineri]